MSAANQDCAVSPVAVGRYFAPDGKRKLLPYSALELERSRRAMVRVLNTFHFRSGNNVLITAQFDEGAQLNPVERAIMSNGLVAVSADSTPYDVGRVESIARRFHLVAAVGISTATLDGLERLGHDALKLFADMVVWARPGAYERLAGKPGMQVYRMLEIGPAAAIECHAGQGAHLDRFEWDIEVDGDELLLTSKLERSAAFERYRTGFRGHVVRGFCPCGNPDPRVIPCE
jgi:phenylacetate-coenzyme A ligase PaaK-like adenylate-forming protein